jgi:hypothetical protein
LNVLSFAIALAALALTGGLAAAALRTRSVVSFCLAAYVIASAVVVALTELLSVVDLVGARGYGAGVGLALSCTAAAWLARGRPRPPHLRVPDRTAFRSHPLLVLLAAVVCLAAI